MGKYTKSKLILFSLVLILLVSTLNGVSAQDCDTETCGAGSVSVDANTKVTKGLPISKLIDKPSDKQIVFTTNIKAFSDIVCTDTKQKVAARKIRDGDIVIRFKDLTTTAGAGAATSVWRTVNDVQASLADITGGNLAKSIKDLTPASIAVKFAINIVDILNGAADFDITGGYTAARLHIDPETIACHQPVVACEKQDGSFDETLTSEECRDINGEVHPKPYERTPTCCSNPDFDNTIQRDNFGNVIGDGSVQPLDTKTVLTIGEGCAEVKYTNLVHDGECAETEEEEVLGCCTNELGRIQDEDISGPDCMQKDPANKWFQGACGPPGCCVQKKGTLAGRKVVQKVCKERLDALNGGDAFGEWTEGDCTPLGSCIAVEDLRDVTNKFNHAFDNGGEILRGKFIAKNIVKSACPTDRTERVVNDQGVPNLQKVIVWKEGTPPAQGCCYDSFRYEDDVYGDKEFDDNDAYIVKEYCNTQEWNEADSCGGGCCVLANGLLDDTDVPKFTCSTNLGNVWKPGSECNVGCCNGLVEDVEEEACYDLFVEDSRIDSKNVEDYRKVDQFVGWIQNTEPSIDRKSADPVFKQVPNKKPIQTGPPLLDEDGNEVIDEGMCPDKIGCCYLPNGGGIYERNVFEPECKTGNWEEGACNFNCCYSANAGYIIGEDVTDEFCNYGEGLLGNPVYPTDTAAAVYRHIPYEDPRLDEGTIGGDIGNSRTVFPDPNAADLLASRAFNEFFPHRGIKPTPRRVNTPEAGKKFQFWSKQKRAGETILFDANCKGPECWGGGCSGFVTGDCSDVVEADVGYHLKAVLNARGEVVVDGTGAVVYEREIIRGLRGFRSGQAILSRYCTQRPARGVANAYNVAYNDKHVELKEVIFSPVDRTGFCSVAEEGAGFWTAAGTWSDVVPYGECRGELQYWHYEPNAIAGGTREPLDDPGCCMGTTSNVLEIDCGKRIGIFKNSDPECDGHPSQIMDTEDKPFLHSDGRIVKSYFHIGGEFAQSYDEADDPKTCMIVQRYAWKRNRDLDDDGVPDVHDCSSTTGCCVDVKEGVIVGDQVLEDACQFDKNKGENELQWTEGLCPAVGCCYYSDAPAKKRVTNPDDGVVGVEASAKFLNYKDAVRTDASCDEKYRNRGVNDGCPIKGCCGSPGPEAPVDGVLRRDCPANNAFGFGTCGEVHGQTHQDEQVVGAWCAQKPGIWDEGEWCKVKSDLGCCTNIADGRILNREIPGTDPDKPLSYIGIKRDHCIEIGTIEERGREKIISEWTRGSCLAAGCCNGNVDGVARSKCVGNWAPGQCKITTTCCKDKDDKFVEVDTLGDHCVNPITDYLTMAITTPAVNAIGLTFHNAGECPKVGCCDGVKEGVYDTDCEGRIPGKAQYRWTAGQCKDLTKGCCIDSLGKIFSKNLLRTECQKKEYTFVDVCPATGCCAGEISGVIETACGLEWTPGDCPPPETGCCIDPKEGDITKNGVSVNDKDQCNPPGTDVVTEWHAQNECQDLGCCVRVVTGTGAGDVEKDPNTPRVACNAPHEFEATGGACPPDPIVKGCCVDKDSGEIIGKQTTEVECKKDKDNKFSLECPAVGCCGEGDQITEEICNKKTKDADPPIVWENGKVCEVKYGCCVDPAKGTPILGQTHVIKDTCSDTWRTGPQCIKTGCCTRHATKTRAGDPVRDNGVLEVECKGPPDEWYLGVCLDDLVLRKGCFINDVGTIVQKNALELPAITTDFRVECPEPGCCDKKDYGIVEDVCLAQGKEWGAGVCPAALGCCVGQDGVVIQGKEIAAISECEERNPDGVAEAFVLGDACDQKGCCVRGGTVAKPGQAVVRDKNVLFDFCNAPDVWQADATCPVPPPPKPGCCVGPLGTILEPKILMADCDVLKGQFSLECPVLGCCAGEGPKITFEACIANGPLEWTAGQDCPAKLGCCISPDGTISEDKKPKTYCPDNWKSDAECKPKGCCIPPGSQARGDGQLGTNDVPQSVCLDRNKNSKWTPEECFVPEVLGCCISPAKTKVWENRPNDGTCKDFRPGDCPETRCCGGRNKPVTRDACPPHVEWLGETCEEKVGCCVDQEGRIQSDGLVADGTCGDLKWESEGECQEGCCTYSASVAVGQTAETKEKILRKVCLENKRNGWNAEECKKDPIVGGKRKPPTVIFDYDEDDEDDGPTFCQQFPKQCITVVPGKDVCCDKKDGNPAVAMKQKDCTAPYEAKPTLDITTCKEPKRELSLKIKLFGKNNAPSAERERQPDGQYAYVVKADRSTRGDLLKEWVFGILEKMPAFGKGVNDGADTAYNG
jgi:hypothetical protein